MNGFAVTVPYGVQPDAFWYCLQCDGHGRRRPAGQIRGEGAAHVAGTGHEVTVHQGTSELLLPLATTIPAPALKELTA